MKWRGNTIKVLRHSLQAVQGGIYPTRLLVLKTYNPSLGLLVLIKIGIITAAISLVVAFSISDINTHGQVRLDFTYPFNFTLPILTTHPFALTTVQRTVTNRLDGWLLVGDQSHGVASEFQGTFVVPDNRTIFATNRQPGGSHIMSSISCSSSDIVASAVLIANTTDRYNHHFIPVAPLDRLAVLFMDLQRVSVETWPRRYIISG